MRTIIETISTFLKYLAGAMLGKKKAFAPVRVINKKNAFYK